MDYNNKLMELKSYLNFNDFYHGKELKNNFKFIESYVKKIEKINYKNQSTEWKSNLYKFIQDAIDVHKRIYCT